MVPMGPMVFFSILEVLISIIVWRNRRPPRYSVVSIWLCFTVLLTLIGTPGLPVPSFRRQLAVHWLSTSSISLYSMCADINLGITTSVLESCIATFNSFKWHWPHLFDLGLDSWCFSWSMVPSRWASSVVFYLLLFTILLFSYSSTVL